MAKSKVSCAEAEKEIKPKRNKELEDIIIKRLGPELCSLCPGCGCQFGFPDQDHKRRLYTKAKCIEKTGIGQGGAQRRSYL